MGSWSCFRETRQSLTLSFKESRQSLARGTESSSVATAIAKCMLLQLIKMLSSKECACKLQGPIVRTGRQHIDFTILLTRLMGNQPYLAQIAAARSVCNSRLSEGAANN